MCVHRCPTQALAIRRKGNQEEILFDYGLCNGCSGDTYCQEHCPEKAVTVSPIPAEEAPSEPVVLIAGEMATCQDCGTAFSPERKLATLLEQKKISPKSVQQYCPECRCKHLLDASMSITGQI